MHPVGPRVWWDEPVDAPFKRTAASERAILSHLQPLPGEAPFIAAWIAVRGAYEMLLHVSPGLVMRLDEATPRAVPLTDAVTAMDVFVMHGERAEDLPDIIDLSMQLRRGLGHPRRPDPRFPDTGETLERESVVGMLLEALWILMGDAWFAPRHDRELGPAIQALYDMRERGARQDPRRPSEVGFNQWELRDLARATALALEAIAEMRVTGAAWDDEEPEPVYRDTVARWWAAVERLFPFQYMTKSSSFGVTAKAPHLEAGSRRYQAGPSEPPGPGEYIVYHASDWPKQIENFIDPEIGFHFAANPELAINAAIKAGKRKPVVFPYRITLRNPVEISNQPNGFTGFRVLDDLLERGILTEDEHAAAMDEYDELEDTRTWDLDEAAAELIQRLMKERGIDSLVHFNTFDAGLNIAGTGLDVEPDWSFIVFDNQQIQPLPIS